MKVNPFGVLAVWVDSGADPHVSGDEAVHCDEGLARNNVDRILRLELRQSSSGGIKRPVPDEVDVDT